jgi:hypothetical protein
VNLSFAAKDESFIYAIEKISDRGILKSINAVQNTAPDSSECPDSVLLR